MHTHTIPALAGCVAAVALSVAPASAAPTQGAAAMVRGAHFSPDTPSVDVYLTSFSGGTTTLALSNVGYGDVSKYQRLDPGLYTVGMRPAGASPSTPVVFSWKLDAKPGAAFTALAIGMNKSLQGRVLPDDLTPPPTGQARVRVIQAADRAPAAHVAAEKGPVFGAKVPFAATTDYAPFSAGTWPVTVTSADNPTVKTTTNITLTAGHDGSIVVLDDAKQGISVRFVDDAVGTDLPPAGPVATGGRRHRHGLRPRVDAECRGVDYRRLDVGGNHRTGRCGAAAAPLAAVSTPARHRLSHDRGNLPRTLMVLMAMLCGGSAALAWTAGHPDFAPPTVNASAAGPVLVARTPVRAGPRPVRIVIPRIAVSADVEPLHRTADGTLDTPPRWDDAGWYADGVVPGQQGPAVIVGHVDSARAGPAVFYHLPRLRRGDDVLVETSDGQNHRFVVDTTHAFAKTSFPTDLVYGPTPLAELRLITCTGSFDRATHNYSENLVVTAYAV